MWFGQTSSRGGVTAAALVISAAALVSCAGGQAAEPTPAEPEQLSLSDAATRYLEAVCPVNDAWDETDVEIDRMRLALGRGTADTGAVSSSLLDVAAKSETALDLLADDSVEWPAGVGETIDDVRETLQSDATQAQQVAKLSAEEIDAYEWQGADEVSLAAKAARASLGLPKNADKSCTQWREQREQESSDDAATENAEHDD